MSEAITVYSEYESLTMVLARLGIIKQPHPHAARRSLGHHVYSREGVKVFEGHAHSCWEWLEQTGQIAYSDERRPEWDAVESLLRAVHALCGRSRS